MMDQIQDSIVFIMTLIFYYIVIVFLLLVDEFKTKKQFLQLLIPFAGVFIIVYKLLTETVKAAKQSWDWLE